MMQMQPRTAQDEAALASMTSFLLFLAAVVAWPALVLAGLLTVVRIRLIAQRAPAYVPLVWGVMALFAVGGTLAFFVWWKPLVLLLQIRDVILARGMLSALPLVTWWWLMSGSLAPLFFLLFPLFRRGRVEDQALARMQYEQRRNQAAMQAASRRLEGKQVPLTVAEHPGEVIIGATIQAGDLAWNWRGWTYLPQEQAIQPGIILGESRSGKSTLMLRLAYLAAVVWGWQVIFLDCKGDEKLARRFVAVMRLAGLKDEEMSVFPHEFYYGWEGEREALFNRLMSLVRRHEWSTSAGAEYYHDIVRVILDLALRALPGLPRSSGELLERMQLESLERMYAGRPEAARIKQLTKTEGAQAAYLRFLAFFAAIGSKLDGTWSLDNARAAYLLLEGVGQNEEAQSLARYFFGEIAQFVTKRKRRDQQVLILIDDAGALQLGRDAAGLIERLAGFGGYVCLSGQSVEGLGPHAKAMISACVNRYLFRQSDSDVSERAGTRKELRYGWQLREGGQPATSIQIAEAASVHPDNVRRLGQGEMIVTTAGRWSSVKVAPVLLSAEQVRGAGDLLEGRRRLDWAQPERVEEKEERPSLVQRWDEAGSNDGE